MKGSTLMLSAPDFVAKHYSRLSLVMDRDVAQTKELASKTAEEVGASTEQLAKPDGVRQSEIGKALFQELLLKVAGARVDTWHGRHGAGDAWALGDRLRHLPTAGGFDKLAGCHA